MKVSMLKEIISDIEACNIVELKNCDKCNYPTVAYVDDYGQRCYRCEEKNYDNNYQEDYDCFDSYIKSNELEEISPRCEVDGCNCFRDFDNNTRLFLVDNQVTCFKHLELFF